MPNREAALEEILLLWLANQNRAFSPFKELFDDQKLGTATDYQKVTAELGAYFAGRPAIPLDEGNPNSEKVSLLDMLKAPLLAAPDSLNGQLAFLRQNWSNLLGDNVRRLLLAVDVLKEEETAIWMRFHPHGQDAVGQRRQQWRQFEMGSHADVPAFAASDQEYERFSPDVDWMPTVVLIAKSTYVWLAQLSRWYGRPIQRLDQIPDEELDQLRDRGMNGLWLIGMWERSIASKTIKRLCGQPGRRRLRIFLAILRGLRRSRRRVCLCEPARPRRGPRHPARQRHGAEPHGHRLHMGRRASRMVSLALRFAVSSL